VDLRKATLQMAYDPTALKHPLQRMIIEEENAKYRERNRPRLRPPRGKLNINCVSPVMKKELGRSTPHPTWQTVRNVRMTDVSEDKWINPAVRQPPSLLDSLPDARAMARQLREMARSLDRSRSAPVLPSHKARRSLRFEEAPGSPDLDRSVSERTARDSESHH